MTLWILVIGLGEMKLTQIRKFLPHLLHFMFLEDSMQALGEMKYSAVLASCDPVRCTIDKINSRIRVA